MPPVEGPASHFFTPEASKAAAAEIRDARGAEVFLIGRRGSDGLVREVESHAYGSDRAVPVLLNLLKPGEVIIHNHPSGYLEPSDADISVSAQAGQQGVGSYIIDNACTRVRIVVRPHDPRERVSVPESEVLGLLGADSPLAALIGDFEDRPQQREMASSVLRAFNQHGVSVVEAGTGTGKSLAYLAPAVLYALENKEKVVVSTATINLQEQVLNKDLPVVEKAIQREFRAELVKGRSNYVCKRKAEFARQELRQPRQMLLDSESSTELRQVLDWAARSDQGDLAELPAAPSHEVWERVVSEADNCLRVRCKFYEECFFYNSRRRAARADILVVNHSLLLSDLAVRRESNNYSSAAVLPPYRHVVLDEAHHLEETATRHFGGQATRVGVRRTLGRLHRADGRGARGVLARLAEQVERGIADGLLAHDFALRNFLATEVLPGAQDARDGVDALFDDIAHGLLSMMGLQVPRPGTEERFRLTPLVLSHEDWRDGVDLAITGLVDALARFVGINREAIKMLADLEEEQLRPLLDIAMEWRALVDRVDNARRLIASFRRIDPAKCQWIELATDRRGRLVAKFCDAPVEVAPILRESLHDRMATEVLTSATLSVGQEFDYLFQRIGLDPRDPAPDAPAEDGGGEASGEKAPAARPIERLRLAAPFDYESQVFFGVPSDLGDPRKAGFDERLADFILRAVSISGGRAFILFTAWGQMRRVHALCAPAIRRLGIECLLQGEDSRDRLLARFRADETSVLFATSSFWEGVDVRGRALELLVIAKLPFAVPNDPITEAQVEALQRAGRDAFNELVVPRAIIRLKQGFGRLIRSKTDRGAVLVADERVVRMGYGRKFLKSLPTVRVRSDATPELMAELEAFYAAGPGA